MPGLPCDFWRSMTFAAGSCSTLDAKQVPSPEQQTDHDGHQYWSSAPMMVHRNKEIRPEAWVQEAPMMVHISNVPPPPGTDLCHLLR